MKAKDLLGVLVSIMVVAWLVATYDFSALWEAIKSADYYYIAPLPILIVGSFVIRTFRWLILFVINQPKSLWNMFSAMMASYLFNNLLPARAGELVRVYMLSKKEVIAKSAVLGTIVVEKVIDLLAVVILLIGMLVFFPFPDWIKTAGWIVGFVAISSCALIIFIGLYGNRIIDAVLGKMAFKKKLFLDRVRAVANSFISSGTAMFHGSRLCKLVVFTVLLWGLEIAIAVLVAAALGIHVSVGELLFVILTITFGTMVPSAPGYVGTYELFGVTALGLIGVEGVEALSFVVVLHAVNFLGASALGLFCIGTDSLLSSSYENLDIKVVLNKIRPEEIGRQ